TERSGSIALVAGQKYDIVIEYYESGGSALTRLLWSSASTPRANVPSSQLFPPIGSGNLVAGAAVAQTLSADARVASAAPSLTSSVSPNPITPGQSARLQ